MRSSQLLILSLSRRLKAAEKRAALMEQKAKKLEQALDKALESLCAI